MAFLSTISLVEPGGYSIITPINPMLKCGTSLWVAGGGGGSESSEISHYSGIDGFS